MTLRYDDRGCPAGLDWTAVSAHCPQDPSVWVDASLVKPKRSGTRLPDEIEIEIVRLHLEGRTAAEISAQVDVSAPTVAAVLDRHEVTERRGRGTSQRTPDHVADEIVRLYTQENLGGLAIQRRVGLTPATVYKILRRRGIMPRSKGGKSRVAV